MASHLNFPPHFPSFTEWMVVQQKASGGNIRRWPEGQVAPVNLNPMPSRDEKPLTKNSSPTPRTQSSRQRPDGPSIQARLAAREIPGTPSLIFQTWQDLLFLHWALPPTDLQPFLPPGLQVDTHQGKAWLGIVPFFMRGIRPRFLPSVPGLSNFLELNVRTYVYDRSGTPGVWFFSLDANNTPAVTLGRSLFNLAYRRAKMDASVGDWIDYSAQRPGEPLQASYRYRAAGPCRLAKPGSLEFFLLERYVLFAQANPTAPLYRGRVHHRPYQIQDVELENFSSCPLQWNRLDPPAGPPHHSCFSRRAKVSVHPLERLGSHSEIPSPPTT